MMEQHTTVGSQGERRTRYNPDELENYAASLWAQRTTAGSVGRKAVLLYLAECCDERGTCFPGQRKMAEATEQGHRTVERHIAEMTAAGLLCHHARPRQDGRGRSSDRYYLHVDGECRNPNCPIVEWHEGARDQPANLAGRSTTNPPTEHDQPATSGGGGNSQSWNSQSLGAEQARTPPKRARQFPEGWEPNDAHKKLAKDHELDLVAETEQFEDHHRAKGSKFLDWDRAFNTWLRNASRWSNPDRTLRVVNGQPRKPRRPPGVPADAVCIDGTWVY
jgi:hypothetical protein